MNAFASFDGKIPWPAHLECAALNLVHASSEVPTPAQEVLDQGLIDLVLYLADLVKVDPSDDRYEVAFMFANQVARRLGRPEADDVFTQQRLEDAFIERQLRVIVRTARIAAEYVKPVAGVLSEAESRERQAAAAVQAKVGLHRLRFGHKGVLANSRHHLTKAELNAVPEFRVDETKFVTEDLAHPRGGEEFEAAMAENTVEIERTRIIHAAMTYAEFRRHQDVKPPVFKAMTLSLTSGRRRCIVEIEAGYPWDEDRGGYHGRVKASPDDTQGQHISGSTWAGAIKDAIGEIRHFRMMR